MRRIAALSLLLLTTACVFIDSGPTGPVDAANLPAFSGREQALMTSAEAAQRQGNISTAEQDYMSAVHESKGHVEAHIALAKLYVSTKQPEKERGVLERARTLQPNNPGVNYLLGKLDLAAGQNAAALEDFNRGLITVPGDLDLSTGAAIANDMLGQHRAAQSIYLQLLARNKGADLTAVKTNLGMSYLFTNEPKKTVALLHDEVKKPGASLVTKYNLALAYGLLDKPLDAKFVMHGADDPAARQASLQRLKRYIADQTPDKTPGEVKPVLVPAASQQ